MKAMTDRLNDLSYPIRVANLVQNIIRGLNPLATPLHSTPDATLAFAFLPQGMIHAPDGRASSRQVGRAAGCLGSHCFGSMQ